MADDLLPYYERELLFLRRQGAEFASRYDKIARRLLLEPDQCADPHVERLLQGVAFLAARVHRRLDDDFPEISGALLQALYPQCMAPVPPMSVVQFLSKGQPGVVPRHCMLHSPLIEGYDTFCRFRTGYPVALLPIEVKDVRLALPGDLQLPPSELTQQVLVLDLESRIPFSALELGPVSKDRISHFPHQQTPLRFYLSGGQQYSLYEQLFDLTYADRCHRVMVRSPGGSLRPVALRPVGFHAEETLLSHDARSLFGYQMLIEYLAFPKKFLFFDILDLNESVRKDMGTRMQVLFPLRHPLPRELSLHKEQFRLGCTPVINLFPQTAESILLDQTQTEYQVIPDVRRRRSMEVYSIDEVISTTPDKPQALHFQPFHALKYGDNSEGRAFWHATRRSGDDDGSEVYLSLCDLNFNPARPAVDVLSIRTTCSNRDLAPKLRFSETGGRLAWVAGISTHKAQRSSLLQDFFVSKDQRHPVGLGSALVILWRLVSHLSLNHLSLCDGPGALRELLRLYDFASPEGVENEIAGIVGLTTQRTVARVRDGSTGFCRGVEIRIELDEDRYVGRSPYLLASVLERFFAHYVSFNSFTQLVAVTRRRKGAWRWPPRSGDKTLL